MQSLSFWSRWCVCRAADVILPCKLPCCLLFLRLYCSWQEDNHIISLAVSDTKCPAVRKFSSEDSRGAASCFERCRIGTAFHTPLVLAKLPSQQMLFAYANFSPAPPSVTFIEAQRKRMHICLDRRRGLPRVRIWSFGTCNDYALNKQALSLSPDNAKDT